MDDLIVAGTAGIIILFAIAALVLYGAFVLVVSAGHAIASGDSEFLLGMLVAAVLAFSGYVATGFWLQKTNQI